MNKYFYKNLRKFVYVIARNKFLYRFVQRFVYDHKGQNNCDIETNGELDFLRRHLQACKVVFDVGANVGEWTQIVLENNSHAEVHCFEPSMDTFKALLANKFISKVRCNNIGLGSAREEKKFYVFGNESTVNSVYLRDGMVPLREYVIKIDTIDNYCAKNGVRRVDFLKIDVEGNELEVLKGAQKMLQEGRIKIVQFEYGGTYIDSRTFLLDVFNYFSDLNYRIYKIYPGYIQLVDMYNTQLEDFQYANYVAIQCDFKKNMATA